MAVQSKTREDLGFSKKKKLICCKHGCVSISILLLCMGKIRRFWK